MFYLADNVTPVAGIGTPASIITAIGVVVIALAGLFGSISVFLPKLKEVLEELNKMRRDVHSVHRLVNGRATATDAYQADLIATLQAAKVEVPPMPPIPAIPPFIPESPPTHT